MSDQLFYPSIPPKRLKTDILSTDSTFKLRDIKWYTGSDSADVSLSSSIFGTGNVAYGCFEPNTPRQEFFTFDPTNMAVAASTGLSITTRGLPWGSDYTTASTARKFNHASGSVVLLFTNAPAMYDTFANKNNEETIANIWTFTETAMPRLSAVHTYGAGEEEYLASKRYVDGVVTGGAADASTTTKGLAEEATQAEIDARTAAGGTSARLFVNPTTLRSILMHDYAADAGSDDAYAITVAPVPTAYTTGDVYFFKANTVNTGAATLNVNALGAKTIVKSYNVTLADGDIKADQIIGVIYDGTNFQLLSPVNMDEAQTFFGITDITGAEAETLSSSVSSDASALHYHKVSSPVTVSSTGNTTDYGAYSFDLATCAVAGWSDTNAVLGFMLGTTTTYEEYFTFKHAAAFGFQPMMQYVSNNSFTVASSATANGFVCISSDNWACTNSNIYKNGSAATISGTARYGLLAHDPTNSYLLVLYSSTVIAKFSGISGTTITNTNSDVTLDTAVAQNRSFIYDNTNSKYICIDSTNKVVRRFNSVGTTVDTVSISGLLDNVSATSKILGLCVYQGRVMVAVMSLFVPGANTAGTDMIQMITTFYPTTMTI